MIKPEVSLVDEDWVKLIISGILFMIGYVGLLQLIIGRHDLDVWWEEKDGWRRVSSGLSIIIFSLVLAFYIVPKLFYS